MKSFGSILKVLAVLAAIVGIVYVAAAYGERIAGGDAAKLPAPAVLMMATVCGARAQGRAEETGMLKVGYDADLILVDFTAPHLMPCHNVLSSLVFSAKGGDVALTMVNGKILYQSGRFPTIDIEKALSAMERDFQTVVSQL